MLSPRAIAMQGVGSAVLVFALQGLVGVESAGVFGGPAARFNSPRRETAFVSVGHRLSLTSGRR